MVIIIQKFIIIGANLNNLSNTYRSSTFPTLTMAQTTIDDDLFSDLESTLSATPATTVLDQVEVQLGLVLKARTQKPPSAPKTSSQPTGR